MKLCLYSWTHFVLILNRHVGDGRSSGVATAGRTCLGFPPQLVTSAAPAVDPTLKPSPMLVTFHFPQSTNYISLVPASPLIPTQLNQTPPVPKRSTPVTSLHLGTSCCSPSSVACFTTTVGLPHRSMPTPSMKMRVCR